MLCAPRVMAGIIFSTRQRFALNAASFVAPARFQASVVDDGINKSDTSDGQIVDGVFKNVKGFHTLSCEDKEKLLFLHDKGLDVPHIMKEYPRVLKLDIKENFKPVIHFFVAFASELPLKKRERLPRILSTYPRLLGYDIEKTIKPILDLLAVLMDLTPAQVNILLPMMFLRYPCLFYHTYDEKKIRVKMYCLAHVIGFEPSEANINVQQIVLRHPQILFYHIDKNTKPKIDCLSDIMAFTPAEKKNKLPKLLLQNPSLLTLSIEQNIKPKLKFFEQMMRFTPAEAKTKISKLIRSFPTLLFQDIEKKALEFTEFIAKSSGCTHAEAEANLPRIITSAPGIFVRCSIEGNLKPKLEYLTNVVGYSAAEVFESPNCLKYNLEERIMVRFEYLRLLGLTKPRLYVVLVPDDGKFATKVAHQTGAHFAAFRTSFTKQRAALLPF